MATKKQTQDFQAIYDQALAAGRKAEADWIEQHGEDNYCGFAWVEIPNGRSPFVNWCKKNSVGSKHWQKGWQIWRCTGSHTQCMNVLEQGASAFAGVLKEHGIDAWYNSRAD
jgi:hypothetical protein